MAAETLVRVKLNSARAGHSFDKEGRQTGQFVQAVGDIIELPEAEAKRHLDAGLASLVPNNSKKD